MKQDGISSARADIEQRVAEFRARQAELQQARDRYYHDVISKVRATNWNDFVTPPDQRERAAR